MDFWESLTVFERFAVFFMIVIWGVSLSILRKLESIEAKANYLANAVYKEINKDEY